MIKISWGQIKCMYQDVVYLKPKFCSIDVLRLKMNVRLAHSKLAHQKKNLEIFETWKSLINQSIYSHAHEYTCKSGLHDL